ncbi:MAG: ABC transporter ATP-binding protein [Betaproteobacteria bacterium]|nr:MAG: ABC transporter ATP-binding protein [Betaproteobacteria bacterium]
MRIAGATKEYVSPETGGVSRALEPIDLEIERDQFVCLIGPSGCGKTTLLNCLAGFVEVTAGAIYVADQRVEGPSRDRGVVFQDYALFPWLNVKQNVAFGPRLSGLGRDEQERRAREYLALVGLEAHANRYPYELSGGMKQRVGLARALANEPKLLLMDEPFGALDALTRETLQSELLRIWMERQKTIVFVTHSIEEAVFLADRIVVMTPPPGRVRADVHTGMRRPRDRNSPEFALLAGQVRELVFEQVQMEEVDIKAGIDERPLKAILPQNVTWSR